MMRIPEKLRKWPYEATVVFITLSNLVVFAVAAWFIVLVCSHIANLPLNTIPTKVSLFVSTSSPAIRMLARDLENYFLFLFVQRVVLYEDFIVLSS